MLFQIAVVIIAIYTAITVHMVFSDRTRFEYKSLEQGVHKLSDLSAFEHEPFKSDQETQQAPPALEQKP